MDWAWKDMLKAPGPKMQNLDTPPASWVAACMLHHLRQFFIHTFAYEEGNIVQNPVTRKLKVVENAPLWVSYHTPALRIPLMFATVTESFSSLLGVLSKRVKSSQPPL